MAPSDAEALPLSTVIRTLREELKTAVEASEEEALRLRVSAIELEMKVAINRQAKVGGGVKFWVLNAEAGGSMAREYQHTIRLKLDPILPGGGELLVSDSVDELPRR